jgi:hypothetical protein
MFPDCRFESKAAESKAVFQLPETYIFRNSRISQIDSTHYFPHCASQVWKGLFKKDVKV